MNSVNSLSLSGELEDVGTMLHETQPFSAVSRIANVQSGCHFHQHIFFTMIQKIWLIVPNTKQCFQDLLLFHPRAASLWRGAWATPDGIEASFRPVQQQRNIISVIQCAAVCMKIPQCWFFHFTKDPENSPCKSSTFFFGARDHYSAGKKRVFKPGP